MKKIDKYIAHPSAAAAVKAELFTHYKDVDKAPAHGDVFYGEIIHLSDDVQVENKNGRLHHIHVGSRSLFVFAHRYAPDFFEGYIPDKFTREVDLLERSGVSGLAKSKHASRKDPTRIKVLGYACDSNGKIINTRDHSLFPVRQKKKKTPRAKLILVTGTAMNCGKTMAAAACCRALTTLGFTAHAGKATGVASCKELFQMGDGGAADCADFTHLGFPATFLLDKEELLRIFYQLDMRLADDPDHYWVLELADGINQRETALLLESPDVRERIHKLIFCAVDSFGAVGGIRVLKDNFQLEPDAISGVCTSSPLQISELAAYTDIPVFNSREADPQELRTILDL